MPIGSQIDCITKNKSIYPLHLIMHYSKLPDESTSSLVTIDFKRFILMNLLMEATYLRFGDSLRILRDLSPDDNKAIIEGVQKCNVS